MNSHEVGQAYGRFLELPVGVVLIALWLAGALIEGTGALALYLMANWSVFVLW